MVLFKKPYRPDPFRFRPPKIKHWLYGMFRIQNWGHLTWQFKIRRVSIAPLDLERLRRLPQSPASNLLLVNHVNFVDPHVLLAVTYRAGLCPTWMAGIEPFDMGRGIFGWFIQSAGAFSVDRGILDRRSLETAQAILDEGRYPLVIYPEGEADYTSKTLQPFYPGATLFALNAAQKHKLSAQPVTIVPIGVRYRFTRPVDPILKAAIETLAHDIRSAAMAEGFPILHAVRGTETPLWQQVNGLIDLAVTYLEHHYPGYEPRLQDPLPQRIRLLRDHLLLSLCKTHLPEEVSRIPQSLDELMLLKNRLRSIIARKRHAPPMDQLEAALSQANALQQQCSSQNPSKWLINRLSRLETQWIGVSSADMPVEKRIRRLRKHLEQQWPYALIRRHASPEDCKRWDAEMNDTRRVKLLTLLLLDLERADQSPEAVDEALVKLEILLFSRFVYRGPKEAVVRVGEPMDVKCWVREHSFLSRKALQQELTAQLRIKIAQLVDARPISQTTAGLATPVL